MVKTVVNLKDYMPPLPEEIMPKGSFTLGIIVRQACCEFWNTKQQPFYNAPSALTFQPRPVARFGTTRRQWSIRSSIIFRESNQEIELPVATVYARFADWARANNISRRQLKLQAKARMIEAAQAAE